MAANRIADTTASRSTPLRVLVVEDESLVAMLLETILEDMGCTPVGPASNIDDGMAMATDGAHLDAALLDVNVAGREVFELCFNRDGTWYHLYVGERGALAPGGGAGSPALASAGGAEASLGGGQALCARGLLADHGLHRLLGPAAACHHPLDLGVCVAVHHQHQVHSLSPTARFDQQGHVEHHTRRGAGLERGSHGALNGGVDDALERLLGQGLLNCRDDAAELGPVRVRLHGIGR